MHTSATRGMREHRKAQTRSAVQEALWLFLGRGYDASTVEEIAAAAESSHMTFYRHFPAKNELATRVVAACLAAVTVAGTIWVGRPGFHAAVS